MSRRRKACSSGCPKEPEAVNVSEADRLIKHSAGERVLLLQRILNEVLFDSQPLIRLPA